MENDIFDEIEQNLENWIREKKFEGAKTYVFTVSEFSKFIIQYLESKGFPVNGVLDNNHNFSGKFLMNIPIIVPEDIINCNAEKVEVVIASPHITEMKVQLDRLGLAGTIDILEAATFSYAIVKDRTEKNFFLDHLDEICFGLRIYKVLKSEYQFNKLYVFPFNSIGDLYVIGKFYALRKDKLFLESFMLLVVGNGCKMIAEMFGIFNCLCVSQKEMDSLLALQRFLGKNRVDIEVLHFCNEYSSYLISMVNYKGIKFLDFYNYVVFNLEQGVEINNIEMNLPKHMDYLEEYFHKNKLRKGKTVILAPYAKSLPPIEIIFWEDLARRLFDLGYDVCTNVAGKREFVVDQTKEIRFPLDKAKEILEYAGIFIGIRSGFCDVVSEAKCTQVILYPSWMYGEVEKYGKPINFYTIFQMSNNVNINELEYTNINDSIMKIENILSRRDYDEKESKSIG